MDQYIQIAIPREVFSLRLLRRALPDRPARLVLLAAFTLCQVQALRAVQGVTPPVASPAASGGKPEVRDDRWRRDSRVQRLPADFPKATLPLDDSRLAIVTERGFSISHDDGRTWERPAALLPGVPPREGRPRGGPMLRTALGTLVLIYGDPTTRNLSWDRKTGEPKPDMRADVWVIRSVDGGRTWTDRQELSALFHRVSPYCLCLIQLTQAADGTLVVPLQLRVGNKNRSILATVVSRDEGRTWQPGTTRLDIGGAGVHDGLLEPTLVPLRDGRVWMLIRTNHDMFYESFSQDSGFTWSAPTPTAIDASSSPGYMLRLRSGRLMLLWNRLNREDRTDAPRRSGKGLSERPASWQRDELALAFSEDDGRTWSPPAVIVRSVGASAYPSAFERRPGEIWVSVHLKEQVSFRFLEADFVARIPGGPGK